jgi:PGF-CTERM protein
MGNMKFKVADSDMARFYLNVDYEIPTGVTPVVGTPIGTPSKTPGVNETVVKPPVNETAAAAEATTAAAAATPAPTKKEPGFEAILAIAGLLAVALLVLRKRK